jgi:hypothetical protein
MDYNSQHMDVRVTRQPPFRLILKLGRVGT